MPITLPFIHVLTILQIVAVSVRCRRRLLQLRQFSWGNRQSMKKRCVPLSTNQNNRLTVAVSTVRNRRDLQNATVATLPSSPDSEARITTTGAATPLDLARAAPTSNWLFPPTAPARRLDGPQPGLPPQSRGTHTLR